MPLQATSGAASYDAFGGGVAAVPQYIEDAFSCFLYTGTSANQTITNNINLSNDGGLVWIKRRSSITAHALFDTNRGVQKFLQSNTTDAEGTASTSLTAFFADGFRVGADSLVNESGETYVSWSLKKQPKFFDVVTYTGNGILGTAIPHNLGSVPGCIIIKRTDTTGSWFVYHRSYNGGVNSTQYTLYLNTTDALLGPGTFGQYQAPTSTAFYPGASVNAFGGSATYVAYLFAHNAGGFGLTGTDNVISCGSYTGNGSLTAGPQIDLGYEPQWLMVKRADSNGAWLMMDVMRGFPVSGAFSSLQAQTSGAEGVFSNGPSPTATGFVVNSNQSDMNQSGSTYIYIAIRRGPMKVPTTGTSVFSPQTATGVQTTNFVVDAFIGVNNRASPGFFDPFEKSRLQGGLPYLTTSSTAAEASGSDVGFDSNTGVKLSWGAGVNWYFQRAPGFFDVVCYTVGGSPQTLSHNLGVSPELIIVKARSTTSPWYVWLSSFSNLTTNYLNLNNNREIQSFTLWGTMTSTTIQLQNSNPGGPGETAVAYLFATCPGVSKVGSYTGNGTTQAIACGFTGGARFVLIKRTDSTGDWYVYDTARGMTVLTDPYLLLNSTAAETATLGSVITSTGGFTVNAAILAAINTNAASYVFLAIA
jgi:hypothetical protein